MTKTVAFARTPMLPDDDTTRTTVAIITKAIALKGVLLFVCMSASDWGRALSELIPNIMREAATSSINTVFAVAKSAIADNVAIPDLPKTFSAASARGAFVDERPPIPLA